MYFLNKYKRGIFNKYAKDKPLVEIIIKDLKYFFNSILFYFANRFENKNILVFPHYPGSKAGLYQLSKKLKVNLSNKINRKYKLAVYWEYSTIRKEYDLLEKLSSETKVINLFCRDISKQKVDYIFTEVFGYSSLIDPLGYVGNCVKKSNINGLHDGVIISCPLKSTDENFIYQKLIETSDSEIFTLEYRVPVIGKSIPYVLKKYKNKDNRFGHGFSKIELKSKEEIFSSQEIEKILLFSQKLNLDFGELDILRDIETNFIYIVDANNTPQQRLGKDIKFKKEIYNKLSQAFENEFLS